MLWQIGQLHQGLVLRVDFLVSSGEVPTSATPTASAATPARDSSTTLPHASGSPTVSAPSSTTAPATIVAASVILTVASVGVVTAAVEAVLPFALGVKVSPGVGLGISLTLTSGSHLTSAASAPASPASDLASVGHLITRSHLMVATVGDAASIYKAALIPNTAWIFYITCVSLTLSSSRGGPPVHHGAVASVVPGVGLRPARILLALIIASGLVTIALAPASLAAPGGVGGVTPGPLALRMVAGVVTAGEVHVDLW